MRWVAGWLGVGAFGVILIGVLLVVIIWLPTRFIDHPAGLSQADWLKAVQDLRTTLLQGLGGLALLGTLYFSARTLQLNRRGQLTERFTKAIDQLGQLGSEKLAVRLGGIYALEQIALDSQELHWPVMEVLTAYLREHAEDARQEAQNTKSVPDEDRWSRQDFRAISDVIRRRRWQWDQEPLDFSGASLGGVHFEAARLPGALFTRARLRSADFAGAHLEAADFAGADLGEAVFDEAWLDGGDFEGAFLPGADFVHAQLRGAQFMAASLQLADFEDAQLEDATFSGADLTSANFRNAQLEGAVFTDAVVTHAKFEGATGLNQSWRERLSRGAWQVEKVSPPDASAPDPM